VDVNELLEKYRTLLAENLSLREENEILKARLGMSDPLQPESPQDPENHMPLPLAALESLGKKPPPGIPVQPDPAEKIRLFMSLFKGREDVYAKRWQNRKGGMGYAPVCRNEWKPGVLQSPGDAPVDLWQAAYYLVLGGDPGIHVPAQRLRNGRCEPA
jgi:hypothetical protein